MRLSRTAAVAFLPFLAAAPALAQGVPVPHDRGVSGLSYAPSSTGKGFELTGQLHMAAVAEADHDLSSALTVRVNGAVVGEPMIIGALARPGCPSDFCWNRCHGVCINLGYICICITFGGGNGNMNEQARFSIPVPPLHPDDVVTVQISALPRALPEIDTTNDTAVLVIGPTPCPGDFNGDGSLNSQDFFDFLTSFFAAAPGADFNADGAINSQDFFDFLTAFFAGC